MKRTETDGRAQAGSYEEMALPLLLFKYLWPFWMFQDASRGDRFARAAAYRHNRDMRVYLPSYLVRWTLSSLIWLGIVCLLSAGTGTPTSLVVVDLMAAASGVVFACAVCVLVATMYVYLYLSHVEG
jgi:hypothetical protein